MRAIRSGIRVEAYR